MKVLRTLIYLFIVLFCLEVKAQHRAVVNWQVTLEQNPGADSSKLIDAVFDDEGNAYLAIELRDTLRVAGQQFSTDSSDDHGLIIKLNTDRRIQWASHIRTRRAYLKNIELDADGNCWVWGHMTGFLSDSGLGDAGKTSAVAVTFDGEGNANYRVLPDIDRAIDRAFPTRGGALLVGRYESDFYIDSFKLVHHGFFYNPILRRTVPAPNVYAAWIDSLGVANQVLSFSATSISAISRDSSDLLFAMIATAHDTMFVNDSVVARLHGAGTSVIVRTSGAGKIKWLQRSSGGMFVRTAILHNDTAWASGDGSTDSVSWIGSAPLREADIRNNRYVNFLASFDAAGKVITHRLLPESVKPERLTKVRDGIALTARTSKRRYTEIDSIWIAPTCNDAVVNVRFSAMMQVISMGWYPGSYPDNGASVATFENASKELVSILVGRKHDLRIGQMVGLELDRRSGKQEWEQIGRGLTEGTLLLGDKRLFGYHTYSHLFPMVSYTNGRTWDSTRLLHGGAELLAFDGTKWYTVQSSNVVESADSGRTFSITPNPDSLRFSYGSVIEHSGRIFAKTDTTIVRLDEDGWHHVFQGWVWGPLFATMDALFACAPTVDSCIIYRSRDGGDTWANVFSQYRSNSSSCFCELDARGLWLYLGAGAHYFSTDDGDTWKDTLYHPRSAERNGSSFVITDRRVYEFDSTVLNWVAITDTLDECMWQAQLVVNDEYIFVASEEGLFRWPRSIRASVQPSQKYDSPIARITEFRAGQLRLAFITDHPVSVTLFDVLGREVSNYGEFRQGAELSIPRIRHGLLRLTDGISVQTMALSY